MNTSTTDEGNAMDLDWLQIQEEWPTSQCVQIFWMKGVKS